jgi:ABC-type glutathione transport system ATPase component
VTVIVATHDPEVAQLASRRISLRDGTVVEDNSHQSPQHAPRHATLEEGALIEDHSHQAPQHASIAKHMTEASDESPSADGLPTE